MVPRQEGVLHYPRAEVDLHTEPRGILRSLRASTHRRRGVGRLTGRRTLESQDNHAARRQ